MKNFIIGSLLLFTGCAHVKFSDARPDDTQCGQIANVKVVNRHWSGISCKEAMEMVSDAYLNRPLFGEWTVYFTGGYAGFTVNRDMNAYTPKGTTYPSDRAIVVQSMVNSDVIDHEFGHAWDVDNNLPNTRD